MDWQCSWLTRTTPKFGLIMEKEFKNGQIVKARRIDNSKEKVSSRYHRTVAHMNSKRLCLHAQSLNQVKQMGSCVEREKLTKTLTLKQRVFEIDLIIQRKKQYSTMQYHWAYQPHIRMETYTQRISSMVFLQIFYHMPLCQLINIFQSFWILPMYHISRIVLLWGLYMNFLIVCLQLF